MTTADSTRETFYTYAHYRADQPERGPFYIGKGKRQRAWKTTGKGRSQHWQRIVAKHGLRVEIIATWPNEDHAYEHERQLIAAMRDMGIPIINLTDGGDGMRNPSQEVRSRLAEAAKAAWSDPVRRAALLDARASESAIKKKSEALKRAFSSQESKKLRSEKIKAAYSRPEVAERKKAITSSEEYRRKMSEALKKALSRPEAKANKAAASARMWQDPEKRERYAQQRRAKAEERWSKLPPDEANRLRHQAMLLDRRKAGKLQTKEEVGRVAGQRHSEKAKARYATLPPEEAARLAKQSERRLRNKRLQREREARKDPMRIQLSLFEEHPAEAHAHHHHQDKPRP